MGNAEFRELTYASPVSADELLRVYRSYVLADSLERLISADEASTNNKSIPAGVDDDTGQIKGGGGKSLSSPPPSSPDSTSDQNNEGWGPMTRTVFTSMFDGQKVPYALVDHLYDSYVVTLREMNGSSGLTRPEFFRVTLKEKLQQVALRKVLEEQQVSATSVQNNHPPSSTAFVDSSARTADQQQQQQHATSAAPSPQSPAVTTVTIDYNNEDVAGMGDMYPDARPDFADMLPLLVTIIPKASSIAALGGHFSSSEAVPQQNRRGRGEEGAGGNFEESSGTFDRDILSPTTYISSVAHTGVYTVAGSDDEEARDRGIGSDVVDSKSLSPAAGADCNTLFAPTLIHYQRGIDENMNMSSLDANSSSSLSRSPSNSTNHQNRGVSNANETQQVSLSHAGGTGDLPRFSSRLAGRSGSIRVHRNSRGRSANSSSGTNFNNTSRRAATSYPDPIDEEETSAIELSKKYDSLIYTLTDQGVVDPGEEAVGLAVEKRLLMVYDVWLRRYQSKYRRRKGEYEANLAPEGDDGTAPHPQYTQLPLSLQQLIRAQAIVASMRVSPPATRIAKKKKAAAAAAHYNAKQQQHHQLEESRKQVEKTQQNPTARSATRFSVTRGLVPLLPRATDKNVVIGNGDEVGGPHLISKGSYEFDSQFPRHLHPPPLMTLEELKNALFAAIKLSVARIRGASTSIKYSSAISSSVERFTHQSGDVLSSNPSSSDPRDNRDGFEDVPLASQRQQEHHHQSDDHQPTKRQFLERRCTGCGAIPTNVSYECLDCFANIKHQHQDELTNYLAALKEYHVKQSLYLKAQDRYVAHTAAARRSAHSPRSILPSPTAIWPNVGAGGGAAQQPMPPLPMYSSITSPVGSTTSTYPTIPHHQQDGDDDDDHYDDGTLSVEAARGVGGAGVNTAATATVEGAASTCTKVVSEDQRSDSGGCGGSRSRSASPIIPSHNQQSHQSLRKRVSFQQRPSPLLESDPRISGGVRLVSEVVGDGLTDRMDTTTATASSIHRILPPSATNPAAHQRHRSSSGTGTPSSYHSNSASYSTLNSHRMYPQLQPPIAPVMPEVPPILQGGGSTAPPLHILGVPITALLCNRCVGTWEGFTSSIHRKKHLKTHQVRRARWAPKPLQVTHDGVECTSCAMRPIVGTRWRCLDCTDQVNLCDACYRDGEVPLGHTVRHNLWNISTPLTIDEEASSLVEDLTRSIYPLLGVPTPGVCHTVTRRFKDHLGTNAELVGDIVCGQQQQSVLVAPGSRVGTASKIKIVNSIANYSNQLLSVVQKSAVERTRDEVRQAEVLRARAGRIANDWPASLSTLLDDPRQLRHFNTPAIKNYRAYLEYQRSTLSSGDVALIAIAAAQVALSDESESLSNNYITVDERNASRIRVSNTKRLAGGNNGGSVAELMRFAVDRYFKDISQLPAFLKKSFNIHNINTRSSNYQSAESMSGLMVSGGFGGGSSSCALLNNNSNLYYSSLVGLLTATSKNTNNNSRSSTFGVGVGINTVLPVSSIHRSLLLRGGLQVSTSSASTTSINAVASSSPSPRTGGAPSFYTNVPGGGGGTVGSKYKSGGNRYEEAMVGGPLGGSGVVERRRSMSQNHSHDTSTSGVANTTLSSDSTGTFTQKGDVGDVNEIDEVVMDPETQELDDMEAKFADLLKKGEARRRAALHQAPSGTRKAQVLSPTTASASPPTAALVSALQSGLLLPAVQGNTAASDTAIGGGDKDMSSPFSNATSPFHMDKRQSGARRGSGKCDTSLITVVNTSTHDDEGEDEDSHTIPLHEVAANVVAAHYAERNSDAELIVTPEVFVAWGSQSEVLSALLRGFEVRYVRLCETVEGVDGTVYNSAAKEAGAISPS